MGGGLFWHRQTKFENKNLSGTSQLIFSSQGALSTKLTELPVDAIGQTYNQSEQRNMWHISGIPIVHSSEQSSYQDRPILDKQMWLARPRAKSAGNLSEREGGQTHMLEQIYHELRLSPMYSFSERHSLFLKLFSSP